MSKLKPEQVLNYLLVEFNFAEEKKFEMPLIKHCRDVCQKCGLGIDDTIIVQRALLVKILGVNGAKADVLLSYFESWIRAEYYAKTSEEKEFAIAVQNALRAELQAKL